MRVTDGMFGPCPNILYCYVRRAPCLCVALCVVLCAARAATALAQPGQPARFLLRPPAFPCNSGAFGAVAHVAQLATMRVCDVAHVVLSQSCDWEL